LIVRFAVGGAELIADLAGAVSIAREVDFSDSDPRHFGAPQAHSGPVQIGGFSGAVATGASCNCSTITLTPHCNGTHTESVGHLTQAPLDAHRVIPTTPLPALVITVTAVDPAATEESSIPSPQRGDKLITRHAIDTAWNAVLNAGAPDTVPASKSAVPNAKVSTTIQLNNAANAVLSSQLSPPPCLVLRARFDGAAPYLTREAAEYLVFRGIEHLVVELPSIDRSEDEGKLTAHRIFFGLPSGARELRQASRAQCTITELARVPKEISDGFYLLQIQAPAIAGDAVPSRPLLFQLLTDGTEAERNRLLAGR
jgi:arylformamidase